VHGAASKRKNLLAPARACGIGWYPEQTPVAPILQRPLVTMGEVVPHHPPKILIFEIEGHSFGLPVPDIQELARVVTIVPLPLAPAVVEGVINLRGGVVPVLDLRARIGLPARELVPSDQLIVVRARGLTVAVRVDRAVELIAGNEEENGHLAKLADGRLAPILNLADLLTQAEADMLGIGRPGNEPDHAGGVAR
jgi:chemotaxis signal transduction protein